MTDLLNSRPPFAGYSDDPPPLDAYATLSAVTLVLFATGLARAKRRGLQAQTPTVKDVALLGMATHKLARLITKDSVTSFLRAPFVRLEERSGSNSLKETARGSGMQRAVGELLSCPECTGHWVALGLVLGNLHAPQVTRTVTVLYSSLAVGDMLQYVYTGLKTRA